MSEGLLQLLWSGTLLLLLLALSTALGVVLHRLAIELRVQPMKQRMEAARRALLVQLGGDPAARLPPELLELPMPELAELVDDLGQVVRGEAAMRLCRIGERLGLIEWLVARARSMRAGVRTEAVRRLLPFPAAEVTAVLVERLADPDFRVRAAAAAGLVGRAGQEHRLAHAARTDPALARPAAFPFWLRLAERLPERFGERFAERRELGTERLVLMLRAAAEAGLVQLAPAMAEETRASIPRVRLEAVRALLDLRHPLAFEALRRLAGDPDPGVRADIATLIGRRGLHAFASLLEEMRDDPSAAVRLRAQEARLRLRRREAPPASDPVPADGR